MRRFLLVTQLLFFWSLPAAGQVLLDESFDSLTGVNVPVTWIAGSNPTSITLSGGTTLPVSSGGTWSSSTTTPTADGSRYLVYTAANPPGNTVGQGSTRLSAPFATAAGTAYQLTFEAFRVDDNQQNVALFVGLPGESTLQNVTLAPIASNAVTATGNIAHSYQWTAASTTTNARITFFALRVRNGNNNLSARLDNVKVEVYTPPVTVPEIGGSAIVQPMTLALLSLLLVANRRRRTSPL